MRNCLCLCLILFVGSLFSSPAFAGDAAAITREFAALDDAAATLDRQIPDCATYTKAQWQQVQKYAAFARLEGNNLILKTAAGEKVFKAGTVPCGQGEGFGSDMTLYLLLGEIPSLHLAILKRSEVEWDELVWVDLKTGESNAIPSLKPAISPNGRRIAFAEYDEGRMSLDGLTVIALSPGLGKTVHYADDKITCLPSNADILDSVSWRNDHMVALTYALRNADESSPPLHATCNVPVH